MKLGGGKGWLEVGSCSCYQFGALRQLPMQRVHHTSSGAEWPWGPELQRGTYASTINLGISCLPLPQIFRFPIPLLSTTTYQILEMMYFAILSV